MVESGSNVVAVVVAGNGRLADAVGAAVAVAGEGLIVAAVPVACDAYRGYGAVESELHGRRFLRGRSLVALRPYLLFQVYIYSCLVSAVSGRYCTVLYV